MKKFHSPLLLLLMTCVAGCASQAPLRDDFGDQPAEHRREPATPPAAAEHYANPGRFSGEPPGKLPDGWQPLVLFRDKASTQYQLVRDQDETVLRAFSPNATSGLMRTVSVDPSAQPMLQWRWKISELDAGVADAQRDHEESPARIILGFDGDKDALPFNDQILFETVKLFSGHDFPYATLMYVWDANAPLGTMAPSRRSGRIRSLVVANGAEGIGRWQRFNRNIVEDYRKVYGEEPGRLIWIGVQTDSDYSGATVETWYGDIQLSRE